LAVSPNDAQLLSRHTSEVALHFKDGMPKCAVAQTVADCTKPTNLRKWGTDDMFFAYVTYVCLEQRNMAAAAKAPELRWLGITLYGGVGGQGPPVTSIPHPVLPGCYKEACFLDSFGPYHWSLRGMP
jgi:hypothetical protein